MNPVIEVPQSVIGWASQILLVGGLVYAAINGLKNIIPAIRDNATLLKILNFVGNLIPNLGVCFVMGQVTDAFDLAKCVGAAVIGSLTSAGLFQAKKEADLARAAADVPAFKSAVS